MIRVGVIGAAGKMGREVLAAIEAAEDLVLSCAVDPRVAELNLDSTVLCVSTPAGEKSY